MNIRINARSVILSGLVVLLSFPLKSLGAPSRSVTIKGSDTMVHLVSTWAEEYMKVNKDAEVSVTGGGSGTGIAAIINGTTDICASSRNITKEEMEKAKAKGFEAEEITVARDGIAIIVNPSNPINELSMEQLKAIYTGESGNWRELKGSDEAIVVLSRESSSGTYVFFQEHVLAKEDYTPKARLMPATQAIVQAVAEDAGAIGYVGLGYAQGAGARVKVLKVKSSPSGEAVMASEENVKNGSYPVARPLFFYTKGTPAGEIKNFVDFALGSEGQKIVKEAGYVPVGN